MTLAKLLDQNRGQLHPVLKLQLNSGMEIFARVWPGSSVSPTTLLPVSHGSAANLPATSLAKNARLLKEMQLGDRRMEQLIDKALKVIEHDIPVMIEGESGTGKEMMARALHEAGPRRSGPFVPVNCASIPEGLIESELFGYQEGAFTGAKRKGHIGKIREANTGTLFLDEIGEMPLQLQARLLRVLQDHTVTPLGGTGGQRVELSVICATNRRVRDAVAAGMFREDLYYRLNGLLLKLPPLKEREDRLDLAWKMLGTIAGQGRAVSIHPEVLAIFERHPWPGNLRQMHNLLRTAIALLGEQDQITIDDLPEDFLDQLEGCPTAVSPDASADQHSLLTDLEARHISATLKKTGGNIAAAARLMGIGRNTLYRKLRNLTPDASRY